MRRRFLHILLLGVITFLHSYSQNYEDIAECLNDKSLPLINIEVNINDMSKDTYSLGKITITQLVKNGEIKTESYNCLLRYRGMTAAFWEKKSFAVKLIDDDGEKLNASLLDLRSDNSWILDAAAIDPLRLRNRVCFDLWGKISKTPWDTEFGNRNGTIGRPVEVFVNGSYNGIYCLSDKINRKLLNLRKAKQNDDGSMTVKGLLYKGTNKTASNTLLTYDDMPTDSLVWNSFELQYPDENPSLGSWQPLMDLIDFNGTTTKEEFAAHYNEWYYIDNIIDYWVFIVALNIYDMPYKNTFLSTPDINFGHRYLITPWDMDAALGIYYNGHYLNQPTNISQLNRFAPFGRLITNDIDSIKKRIALRWFELTENQLHPDSIKAQFEVYTTQLVESGAWAREYQRWKNNPVALKSNIDVELNYAINWYRNNLSYISGTMSNWCIDDWSDVINAATVTRLYNYILNGETDDINKLDFNEDGYINAADVTVVYNIILGIGN